MKPIWLCSECGADSGVYDSRPSPKGFIIRQRKCLTCDYRWATYEVTDIGDLAAVRKGMMDVARALGEAFVALNEIAPKPAVKRWKRHKGLKRDAVSLPPVAVDGEIGSGIA